MSSSPRRSSRLSDRQKRAADAAFSASIARANSNPKKKKTNTTGTGRAKNGTTSKSTPQVVGGKKPVADAMDVDETGARPSTLVIDHTAFPHIVDIIMYSSFETLLNFRRMNRGFRDRIDRDLARIVIKGQAKPKEVAASDKKPAVPPPPSLLDIKTRNGFVLSSLRDDFDLPHPSVWRYYYHNDIRPTIQLVGQNKGQLHGFKKVLFWPLGPCPRCDTSLCGNSFVVSTLELVPGADRSVSGVFPGWSRAIMLVDDWKSIPDRDLHPYDYDFDFDDDYFDHSDGEEDPFWNNTIVYPIDGQAATTRLVLTKPPEGSRIVYDFSDWRPNQRGLGLDPSSDDEPNPRMMNIIEHATLGLSRSANIVFAGLHVVDREWLDPLYVSGEPWRLCPSGSKNSGRRMPFSSYLRKAVIANYVNGESYNMTRMSAMAAENAVTVLPQWDSWRRLTGAYR